MERSPSTNVINLDHGEKILKIVRKHWIVFAFETSIFVILAIAPVVLLPLIGPTVRGVILTAAGNGKALGTFLYALWLLVVWVILFNEWTDYYLDMLVITNNRIIDIEQKGLFRRDVASCFLKDVEDVASEIHGFLPTLIGYGTISVQTAGERREFVMRSVADVDHVKLLIVQCHREAVAREGH